MNRAIAGGAVALLGIASLWASATAALAQNAPLFREGECGGVLCSTIGGSQAPQNQPRKSLFPEGECGGVLCGAIGGSQAPRHAEAPPPCGGGILCDMAPYAMGQPFTRPAPAPQPVAAPPTPEPTPMKASTRHRRGKHGSRQASAAN